MIKGLRGKDLICAGPDNDVIRDTRGKNKITCGLRCTLESPSVRAEILRGRCRRRTWRSCEPFMRRGSRVNPPDAVEPGTRRGRRAFAGIRDAYDDVRIEPEEFIDAGDDVVVIARIKGTGRGSGVEVDWRQGYIWTIQSGKGVRFRWFSKPEQALEAAGLQE